jgi:hypothetical protein
MRFRSIASFALVGLAIAGCTSSAPPPRPETSIETAPPRTDPPETVATTTTPTTSTTSTVAVTTVAAIVESVSTTEFVTVPARPPKPGDPTNQDLKEMFAAAIESDRIQDNELDYAPSDRSLDRLLTVMTPQFAEIVLKTYAAIDARNRRFEKGSVDERSVIRMENFDASSQKGEVILCRRNNSPEFDTKGTLDRADDSLVQADLGTSGWRVQMLKVDGIWKRASTKREVGEKCLSVFS